MCTDRFGLCFFHLDNEFITNSPNCPTLSKFGRFSQLFLDDYKLLRYISFQHTFSILNDSVAVLFLWIFKASSWFFQRIWLYFPG